MRRRIFTVAILTGIGMCACALWPIDRSAQAGASRSRTGKRTNLKAIDYRAGQAQQTFIREAAELAKEYEKAGYLEKARQMLETIHSINPKVPGVQKKIKELDEAILSSNEFEFELDTSQGWGKPVARVYAGRTFRIQATGTYRFVTDLEATCEGFPTDKLATDMAPGIPCGALMGVYMVDNKPGESFAIGAGKEFTPKKDGILLLRVNAPAGSQCRGQIQVRVSGYARGL